MMLAAFRGRGPAKYLFNPRAAVAERNAARAACRATKRYPSHLKANASKRKVAPKHAPSDRYTAMVHGKAIVYGVKKMNAARQRAGLEPLAAWTSYPLRHSAATIAAATFNGSLEAAQCFLGHAKANVTEIYAERD